MTRIYVIVGQGGDGNNSLLDKASLNIEAAFTDWDEADRYASMGDMEIHPCLLNPGPDDDIHLEEDNPTGDDLSLTAILLTVTGLPAGCLTAVSTPARHCGASTWRPAQIPVSTTRSGNGRSLPGIVTRKR